MKRDKLRDIVYVLKNDYDSEELKYSVRSVVKNFPFRKICFVGGGPEDVTADIRIYDKQQGATKWERSTSSLKLALANDDLTEDIWLFNDDFFVMNRVEPTINYFGGTLERRVQELKERFPTGSAYTNGLLELRRELFKMNKDTLSFCLHLPMLVNRTKALNLLEEFPEQKMFRSFYGNYYEVPCTFTKDVKVLDLTSIPNTDYLSTTDKSFKEGKVGEFIRACFPDPCRYEIGNDIEIKDIKELYSEEGDLRL